MIIFQPEMFHKPETYQEFLSVLKNTNTEHLVIDDFDLINQRSSKLDDFENNRNSTILHTLTLYRNLQRPINRLVPGTTFNFTDYSFSKLSSLIERSWFLNNDFEIKTLGDLLINNSFPSYEIFIRPDSGNKAFTGNVFNRETFSRDFKDSVNDYSKLMIISSPKEIYSEFRFHIYNNQIASQAFYTYKEDWSYQQEDWDRANSFMKKFLKEYNICELLNTPLLVLDVAVGNPRTGLVEHNCFNTSGIYPGSDVTGIINALKGFLIDG